MHADQTSPDRLGRNIFGLAVLAAPLLGLAVLVVWLFVPAGPPTVPTDPPADDGAALARVAACRDAPLAYLIAHTSDNDWRVRAAAYAELARHAPLENVPLRDTPIDERETIILDWLDRNEPGYASDMCEWYTRLEHLRFGGPLVQRCMTCHVGVEPTPKLIDTNCIACHETIHQQWSGTAHANSLSHLPLVTIDPATRQQKPFDFGKRKGMSCVACHEPVEPAGSTPDASGPDDGCLALFDTVSCGTCHSQTQTQWRAWLDSPRFRKASWPPGSLELVDEASRRCADCHMPGGEHLWGARRDVALLRSGIVLDVSQGEDGGAVVTLRNLAGHNYPSGRTRRALQLYVQIDDEPEQLIATFADELPSTATDPSVTGPTLAPGETRSVALPGRPVRVQARLIYARNRYVPGTYTVEIVSADHDIPTAGKGE
jgi:hypothetical protein